MERLPSPDLSTRLDTDWVESAERHFDKAGGSTIDKLMAFPRFVDRTSLSRFVVRYELIRKILPVQGSIIECGVHNGAGLFTFASTEFPARAIQPSSALCRVRHIFGLSRDFGR